MSNKLTMFKTTVSTLDKNVSQGLKSYFKVIHPSLYSIKDGLGEAE